MRKATGASFAFLSDPEGQVIDLFDLRHLRGGPEGIDIAQSATFLLSPEGRILWFRVAENFRVRPLPSAILGAIDQSLGN